MSFSYGPNPASPADHVRELLGQTTAPSDLSDEEIGVAVSFTGALVGLNRKQPPQGTLYRAAYQLALTVAARYANAVNWSATTRGSLSFQNAQKFEHWTALAAQMKSMLASSPLSPYAGGISVWDKQFATLDTNRVKPFFTRSMETQPGLEENPTVDSWGGSTGT